VFDEKASGLQVFMRRRSMRGEWFWNLEMEPGGGSSRSAAGMEVEDQGAAVLGYWPSEPEDVDADLIHR
jgi:hypothetical protein